MGVGLSGGGVDLLPPGWLLPDYWITYDNNINNVL